MYGETNTKVPFFARDLLFENPEKTLYQLMRKSIADSAKSTSTKAVFTSEIGVFQVRMSSLFPETLEKLRGVRAW
jgi:hypothetical protein